MPEHRTPDAETLPAARRVSDGQFDVAEPGVAIGDVQSREIDLEGRSVEDVLAQLSGLCGQLIEPGLVEGAALVDGHDQQRLLADAAKAVRRVRARRR